MLSLTSSFISDLHDEIVVGIIVNAFLAANHEFFLSH